MANQSIIKDRNRSQQNVNDTPNQRLAIMICLIFFPSLYYYFLFCLSRISSLFLSPFNTNQRIMRNCAQITACQLCISGQVFKSHILVFDIRLRTIFHPLNYFVCSFLSYFLMRSIHNLICLQHLAIPSINVFIFLMILVQLSAE